ncbi:MAG: nucleotidyltransferase domain-containing protein [Candidatus Micrarchaeia archaeon]|jgi:hypothetical protein
MELTKTEWKIIELFAENSTKSYFVKEISRLLNISSGSSSKLCFKLSKENILIKKQRGNIIFYSLNQDLFYVKELKKLIFLSKLKNYKKILQNNEYQSVVLYGSYANGEYIEKSDIDLLIITNIDEKKVRKNLESLYKLNKEISILVFPFSKWLELKKKNEPIYKEIIANNILLYGEKLVI